MPEHMKENIGHMTLLARQNQTLAQQNQELMAKLLEKDEQIRRVTEESRRDLLETKIEILDLDGFKREKDAQMEMLVRGQRKVLEERDEQIDRLASVKCLSA